MARGSNRRSVFGLGSLHRRMTESLAHFAGLLSQGAHLRLDVFAVQLHHLGQILGVQEVLGVIKRGPHVLLGKSQRLCTDVFGAGAHRLVALLDRTRGRLRTGEELLEGLARLLEARFSHRAHLFRNFETDVVAHYSSPSVPCSPRFFRHYVSNAALLRWWSDAELALRRGRLPCEGRNRRTTS